MPLRLVIDTLVFNDFVTPSVPNPSSHVENIEFSSNFASANPGAPRQNQVQIHETYI
jgi:hypothetical protein